MATINATQEIRNMVLAKAVRNLQNKTANSLTQIYTRVNQVNSSLKQDILQTGTTLNIKLLDKISTSNFTKLITDSQYVVDQLYSMVSKKISFFKLKALATYRSIRFFN